MTTKAKVLVTGAGGFIGDHLVSYLKNLGYWVRGVDIKEPEFSDTEADEFEQSETAAADLAHSKVIDSDGKN